MTFFPLFVRSLLVHVLDYGRRTCSGYEDTKSCADRRCPRRAMNSFAGKNTISATLPARPVSEAQRSRRAVIHSLPPFSRIRNLTDKTPMRFWESVKPRAQLLAIVLDLQSVRSILRCGQTLPRSKILPVERSLDSTTFCLLPLDRGALRARLGPHDGGRPLAAAMCESTWRLWTLSRDSCCRNRGERTERPIRLLDGMRSAQIGSGRPPLLSAGEFQPLAVF